MHHMWTGGVLSSSFSLLVGWMTIRQNESVVQSISRAIKNTSVAAAVIAAITELSQVLIKMQMHLYFALHCWFHPNQLPIFGQTQLHFRDNKKQTCE